MQCITRARCNHSLSEVCLQSSNRAYRYGGGALDVPRVFMVAGIASNPHRADDIEDIPTIPIRAVSNRNGKSVAVRAELLIESGHCLFSFGFEFV